MCVCVVYTILEKRVFFCMFGQPVPHRSCVVVVVLRREPFREEPHIFLSSVPTYFSVCCISFYTSHTNTNPPTGLCCFCLFIVLSTVACRIILFARLHPHCMYNPIGSQRSATLTIRSLHKHTFHMLLKPAAYPGIAFNPYIYST